MAAVAEGHNGGEEGEKRGDRQRGMTMKGSSEVRGRQSFARRDGAVGRERRRRCGPEVDRMGVRTRRVSDGTSKAQRVRRLAQRQEGRGALGRGTSDASWRTATVVRAARSERGTRQRAPTARSCAGALQQERVAANGHKVPGGERPRWVPVAKPRLALRALARLGALPRRRRRSDHRRGVRLGAHPLAGGQR